MLDSLWSKRLQAVEQSFSQMQAAGFSRCAKAIVQEPQELVRACAQYLAQPWPSKPLFYHRERSRVNVLLPLWRPGATPCASLSVAYALPVLVFVT